MRRLSHVLAAILLPALILGCTEEAYRGMLVFGGQHELQTDETVTGDLLMLSGDLLIPSGSAITGSAYLTGGTLELHGTVMGDVSLIGGRLVLEPGAAVTGNVYVGGGELEASDEASIGGRVASGLGVKLPTELALPETTFVERLPSFAYQLAFVLILGTLLLRFTPTGIQRVEAALLGHPLVSVAMGLLVGVIGISLFVLIAFTIVLIPVSLLGLFMLALAVMIGWIAAGYAVGGILRRRYGWRALPSGLAGITAFMFGTLMLELIPLIGVPLVLLASCLGLGAVFITAFGTRRFVPAVDEAAV